MPKIHARGAWQAFLNGSGKLGVRTNLAKPVRFVGKCWIILPQRAIPQPDAPAA
jgi:hypothetical protein